ncbi:uncharacterized protein BXIN_0336 [Babesia sp. Xinjiang]|uniref:uncharacterized protein n=1 Tax=Babesia sp. Xinjiang TaxID=462227 RepID=UPI000A22EC40|nr:uncharacterized protein BXIN_0336 [Babesia sp. Xinjiang]ORM41132.1 hypothetical protein BXIN_0336 [Babesia sp. Xinjiang]
MVHCLPLVCICVVLLGGVGTRKPNRAPLAVPRGFKGSAEILRGPLARKIAPAALLHIPNLFSYLDRVRTRNELNNRLSEVQLYVITDEHGRPLVSHYPSDALSQDTEVTTQESAGRPPKTIPETSQIPHAFVQLFREGGNSVESESSQHDINHIKQGMPKVVLYFMDPNACAAQIHELRRQGINVGAQIVTLSDYLKDSQEAKRHYDPILLPIPEALTRATLNGKSTFRGTPIFTTDPPIVITNSEDGTNEYNPETDKLAIFFSPEQAEEVYRSAWWSGRAKSEVGGRKTHYKLLPGTRAWYPKVLVTSLEDLCNRIETNEAYWAVLIRLVPPSVELDHEAHLMLRNEKETGKSLWKSLHKFVTKLL